MFAPLYYRWVQASSAFTAVSELNFPTRLTPKEQVSRCPLLQFIWKDIPRCRKQDASLRKQPFPRVCLSPELNNYSHHLIIMKRGPRCFNQCVAARTFPLLMAILRSSGMGGGVTSGTGGIVPSSTCKKYM